MLINTAVSVPQSAQPQLSHHLSKPWDLWRDRERRHQNLLSSTHSRLLPYPLLPPTHLSSALSGALTITHDAFGNVAVVPELPGCDTNSPLLVM